MTLDSLPEAARKTAKEMVKDCKIEEVEPAFEDGIRAFEVEYEKDGVEMAVVVSPEGKVLSTESRLSVNQTPEVIQKATKNAFPGSSITHIKKVGKDGKEFFKVTLRTTENKVEKLKLDLQGNKLE
jgi:uncharacterized membrane protein YkoI